MGGLMEATSLTKWDYGLERLRISHSSLQLLRSCPRKFEFRKLFKHAGREDSLPAEVGKALHEGVQNWFQNKDRTQAIWQLMLHYPYHLCSDVEDDRSLWAAYATLETVLDTGPLAEWEIATVEFNGEARPAIEVPFEITISNFSLSDGRHIPVSYIGKIDLLLFNRLTHEYRVVDVKTHRDRMKDLAPKYEYDDQCLPYGMILEKMLGHEVTSFEISYLSTFVDLEKPWCKLYTFTKGPEEIQDWARSMVVDLQMLKFYYDLGWFKKHAASCTSFNRKCIYHDFCRTRDNNAIRGMIEGGEDGIKFEDDGGRFPDPWYTMDLELAA
jgi:hypothetical protein